MTGFSALMDRGREVLILWPVVEQTNNRGTTEVYPDFDNPVRVRVTTSKEPSRIADLPGQVEIDLIRVTARSFPRGVEQTWSRVRLNGTDYDLSEPPRESFGPSRATNHFEFKLRSRANLNTAGDPEGPVPIIRRETR